MKGKLIFPTVILVGLASALFLSPLGVKGLQSKLSTQQEQERRVSSYEWNVGAVESSLRQAVAEFNSKRTFDVSYTDVSRIHQVLYNIPGIEVQSMEKIDPMNGYIECGYVVEGDTFSAVKINMLVASPETVLSVLYKLQVPVHSFNWDEPNKFSVIFLTGGEV